MRIECVKVVYKVLCWRFLAGPRSMVRYTSWSWQRLNQDINWEQSTLYHTGANQHTQNSQIKHWKIICTSLVMLNCFDARIPRKLSEKKENLLDRISTCNCLLKGNKNVPFLKSIVIGDDKWILYDNVQRKRLWDKWNKLPPTTTKLLFIQRRWLCVYGGIGKQFSMMNSFWKAKQLIPTGTAPI